MTTAMTEDYRLFVNEDRTLLVRLWPAVQSQVGIVRDIVEVATREHPDAIWGPPVLVQEEK